MTLQKDIRRSRPFEVPEEEAYLNLLRTCHELSGQVEQLLREHDLSEAKYNVLRILRGATAGEGYGLPSLEIGRRMVTRVPDVTRLIDRLEAAGLAERRRCDKDRRVTYVAITAGGLEVLRLLDKPLEELHRAQFGHLSRAELKELNRLLWKARNPGGE